MNRRVIISNRAASGLGDGWIHIVPSGELPNKAAGIIQILDEKSIDSILANIAADKRRMGDKWPGIYAGREHFIYDPDQDSAALAWFKDFEKRADGIWASADGLTPAGRDALNAGEYKYTSFVTDPSDLERVGGPDGGLPRLRVMKIETVGFTNQANGKELLTPITNRDNFGDHGSKEAWEAARSENIQQTAANKAANEKVAAQSQAASAGRQLVLSPLETFCQSVLAVIKAATVRSHQCMGFRDAWDYARAKFPEQYSAAFGGDSPAGGAAAVREVTLLANRIGTLAGQNFQYGWEFVRQEMPRVFNRLSASPARIQNRIWSDRKATEQQAAKVFNRLMRVEMAASGLTDSQAWRRIETRHPSLSALASGKITPHDALTSDPGLCALLSE
jgi:hypothetical protein